MLKRLILRLLPIAFVAPLILGHQASAQEIDFIVQLSCPSYGTAEMSFQNHSDRTLRSTAFVRTPSGSTNAGAIIAEPYDSDTLTMSPSIMPENGWSIIVEDMTGSAGALYSETYTGGFCTEANIQPTAVPTITVPTAVVVPTPTTAPATEVPVANNFTLVSAQRMCADQSFVATWSGANVTVVEFSITNTSDEWTSGWVAGDPASSSFTMSVDHHSYDKSAARATFEDGSTTEAFMDIGACTEAPAPPPPPPAVVDPPANPPAAAPVVSSLPSTGSGLDHGSLVAFGSLALLAGTFMVVASLRKRI